MEPLFKYKQKVFYPFPHRNATGVEIKISVYWISEIIQRRVGTKNERYVYELTDTLGNKNIRGEFQESELYASLDDAINEMNNFIKKEMPPLVIKENGSFL